MKCFQKQPHICFNIKNISCTFSFRSSRTLISFRSSLTFIKKYEMFPEAATHLLKHKKYQLHKFSRFLHKIYTLWVKIFHNLSMVMKTSLMDGLKTLFRNLTALYECHRPRHNAYRNKQITQACFARMSICLDHKP